MKCIILCGGSGKRLFPLSREQMPKQFIKLPSFGLSLFQLTIERARNLCSDKDIVVVSNERYEDLVKKQLNEINASEVSVLLESRKRGSLPAVCYALRTIEGDEICLVLPSDHLIKGEEQFFTSVKKAMTLAQRYIVLFGISPTYAHTGFGYIKPGEKLDIGWKVESFKEKPDYETARQYLAKGFLWNSGMFLFKKSIFLKELVVVPEKEILLSLTKEKYDLLRREMVVDKEVLEKSHAVAVLPLKIEWYDLGSFDALHEVLDKDEHGNVKHGSVILINSKNNFIHASGKKYISLLGVEDLIVVDTDDVLLICKREHAQEVKRIIDYINIGDKHGERNKN